MNKSEFISELKEKISKLEITEEEKQKHTALYKNMIYNLTEEEAEKSIAEAGGIDGIINAVLDTRDTSDDTNKAFSDGGKTDSPGENKIPSGNYSQKHQLSYIDGEENNLPESAKEFKDDTNIVGVYPAEIKKPKRHNFIFLLILTLPLTLPLFLAINFVFFALFGAMASVIFALLVTVTVLVISGTLIALIGVIYGIIQTFTYLPVGLLELGIGMCVGGTVMFVSILLYNIAIRLIPFIIKKTALLYKIINAKIFKYIRTGGIPR